MDQEIKMGIIGDYDPSFHYHIATDEAINHATKYLAISLSSSWISTQALAEGSVRTILKGYHALLCAPGDYINIEGAVQAIQFAREKGVPFIGT